MVQDNQVLLGSLYEYQFQKTSEILIFWSLIPINSVVFLIGLISSNPNSSFVAFHYSSYGTFCVHSKAL